MTAKKAPVRHCVACREGKAKGELVRVACSPDGVVALDESGKLPGRGAYVCLDSACVQKAQKSRAFERQFKRQIDITIYEVLMVKCNDG